MTGLGGGVRTRYPLHPIEGAVPLKMRPLAFDAPSEIQFVRDLEAFYQSPLGRQVIGKRSLYPRSSVVVSAGRSAGVSISAKIPGSSQAIKVISAACRCSNSLAPASLRKARSASPKAAEKPTGWPRWP